MATLACQTYASPFKRHLSFYDRDRDGIIYLGESLKANLSLGLDFPAALIGAVGLQCYYGNTRPFYLGPFRGIEIQRVTDERNMLQAVAPAAQSASIDRKTLVASSGAKSLLDRAHVWGLWALAADSQGKLSMNDVRRYQEGTMLYELEKRRRDRSDVLPLKRGGPIIVSGHSCLTIVFRKINLPREVAITTQESIDATPTNPFKPCKEQTRLYRIAGFEISVSPQAPNTKDGETKKSCMSSDHSFNTSDSTAIKLFGKHQAGWSMPQPSAMYIFNHDNTEELSHRHVDWSAVSMDPDSSVPDETEPPPPLDRSIYPLVHQKGWRVTVSPPNPDWPKQFDQIAQHVHHVLTTSTPPVPYAKIEHIGSTSIPNLSAKPNIDILVTFQSQSALLAAVDAFIWEVPTQPPFIRYTLAPNGGGIQGRESLKLYVTKSSPYYATTPERSVYLIFDSPLNRPGQVAIRSNLDLKTTLTDPANLDLLREYESVKLALATKIFKNSIDYASEKNPIVRKILIRAGWTDEEIDEKERFSERRPTSPDIGDLPY